MPRMFTSAKASPLLLCLGWSLLRAAEPVYSASLTVRQLATDNVFTQDAAPLDSGETVAALPAQTRAWITDIGASVGINWQATPAFQLNAVYAPETFIYSRYRSENHTDHRLVVNTTGAHDAWLYDLKTSWLKTIGSTDSPIFNRLGGSPPVGVEPVRARRAQDLYRGSGRVTRRIGPAFVRGMFAYQHHDFHTRQSAEDHYANYVDRSEWSAGPEAGWQLRPDLALVASVRRGGQHQGNLLGVAHNYGNRFTRWLVGLEGQATRTLTFNALLGPDRRTYGPTVRTDFDRRQTATYFEGGATWSPRTSDRITLTGRRYLWLTTAGRGAYLDALWDLNWKHQFSPRWSVSTGWNEHILYTSHYNTELPRHDFVHALSCTITRQLDAKTKVELGFIRDWSETVTVDTPSREFHRLVWSVGCTRTW